ncbi:uncharacterized protein LOC113776796 [Coffea eugenioides]|uniref:uncharacterized protein LOC113776796 n=1 Tax=Coffea eugenioides TaxID=49369 RepID=UPI000F6047D4|nr:uncharacterized protein LOC113776796 [Coffea eugenioides]
MRLEGERERKSVRLSKLNKSSSSWRKRLASWRKLKLLFSSDSPVSSSSFSSARDPVRPVVAIPFTEVCLSSGNEDQPPVISNTLENRECFLPVESVVIGRGEFRYTPDVSNLLNDRASPSSKKNMPPRSASSINEETSSFPASNFNQSTVTSARQRRKKNRNTPLHPSSAISAHSKKRSNSSTVRTENAGRKRRRGQPNLSLVNNIPNESLALPDATPCGHCGAKRFHLEPPNFCCAGGEISVVAPPMPYDLKGLFIGSDEESFHFRNNARTYNNNLGFTSFTAKYDSELTKNTKGVYIFRVQGQVYHFLNGLVRSDDTASGIQLYFFDTDEELAKRVAASDKLRATTLRLLMRILSDNPYAKFFRNLSHVPNINNLNIVLCCYPALDQRVYNLPSASQVAAIWTENQDESDHMGAHIQVYTHSNSSYRIKHYHGCYDPLRYPILFPCGECEWHPGVKRARKRKRREDSCEEDINIHPSSVDSASSLLDREQRAADRSKNKEDTVSAREYYCYRFQIRDDDESMLLHSLRLLQQYAVDGYVKIETSRLDFHRNRQNNIRSEVLQGVLDSISISQTNASKVGRRTILPASFIGRPRDMRRRYLDDRPDLLARVFRAKFELLKSEVLNKQIFGEVAAYVYVIEFQKRGFPHAHMLLILKLEYKLLNPESYDRVVCAKIPDRFKHPHLYSLVVKHMIHGPCGDMDRTCPCMKDGRCKNHYPKSFCSQTTHAEDSYPQYRRRDD